MSGKSSGTGGIVSDAVLEFCLERVVGSVSSFSYLSLVCVHLAVELSSCTYSSWEWTVGSGPGWMSGAALAGAPVRSVAPSTPTAVMPPVRRRLMRFVDVDLFTFSAFVRECHLWTTPRERDVALPPPRTYA